MTLLMHIGGYWFAPRPPESHHWFGAIFLGVGTLLIAEGLSGAVWFRSRIRTLIWPAGVMFMGEGLVITAALDPAERIVHFRVGVLLLVAGWLEWRYRSGLMSRFTTDAFVVPALLASAFEMGVIHGHGSTVTAVGHACLALMAVGIAGARLYQARDLTSLPRHLLTGSLVVSMALTLLIFEP